MILPRIAASVQGSGLPHRTRDLRQPLRRQGLDMCHCLRNLPRLQVSLSHPMKQAYFAPSPKGRRARGTDCNMSVRTSSGEQAKWKRMARM